MHAVFAIILLANTPLDEPAWQLDSPQRLQQLVALYLQQRHLAPAQNQEILDAVAAAIRDPEIVRRYPRLSVVRKKELKEALTNQFYMLHDQTEYHTSLYVKGVTARTVQTIRGYTLLDPEPAPTAEALEQVHTLRALCEARLLELYPGIQQFRNPWARIVRELNRLVKVQESDLNPGFKAALPDDDYQKLLREIREIPAVTVGQGFSRAYFAIDRRQKGLRPPPPDEELYGPGQTRVSWRAADHDTREAWLTGFGASDLTLQYTAPIYAAYDGLLPRGSSSRLSRFLQFEGDDSMQEMIRRAQAEEHEIYMRLVGATPRGGTRPNTASPRAPSPAPGPPQPAPPGVAAPPLENRSSLILIVAGLAAAAVPLIAFYLFGRRNRN